MSRKYNPKPPYPDAFRWQMVRLAHGGCMPSELFKRSGCHEITIRAWVRRARRIPRPVQSISLSNDERHGLIELWRNLSQVHLERDILARTTAWFAHSNATASTLCWV